MGKGSWQWALVLYVACALVIGGYYYFSSRAHVESPIVQTMAQAASDDPPAAIGLVGAPKNEKNTPDTFIARISWGRTAMLYSLASLLALFVIGFEIGKRAWEAFRIAFPKVRETIPGVSMESFRVGAISFVAAAIAIASLICYGISEQNALAVGVTKELVTEAIKRLHLSKSIFESSAAPGIVIGLMLLYLAHLTIQASHGKTGEDLRKRANAMRRATYAAAAVLATAVVHTNVLHLLPVPLLPTVGNADEQKAFVESIKQVAATYSMAQGTVWTLLLMAIYIPVALAIDWRTTALATAEHTDPNTTQPMKDFRNWLKDRKHTANLSPFGILLSTDELDELQEIPNLELTITNLLIDDGTLTGALVAVPGPTTISHKTRHEWAEKHGLHRSLYQQLTTVAAVLSPFLTGTAMLELIDAFGR